MNEEELIKEQKSLNIQQAEIITELQQHTQNNNQKHIQAHIPYNDKLTTAPLTPGNQIKLLTRGVLSKKGEVTQITRVKGNTVHLRVNSNGHNTFRKIKNVKKLKWTHRNRVILSTTAEMEMSQQPTRHQTPTATMLAGPPMTEDTIEAEGA